MMSLRNPLEIFPIVLGTSTTWASLLAFVGFGTISLFISSYSNLDMLGDQIKAAFTDTEDVFDFIIVGGGSAGSVVANRLSESGEHTVLLLESGGEPNPYTLIPGLALLLLNRPLIDWQLKTVKQKNACLAMVNQKCFWPRGKGLGGSSNLNFLIYMRGNPSDFDRWAVITNDSRWNYESVLPFFKKSEDYTGQFFNHHFHSQTGDLKVSQSAYSPGGLGEYFLNAGIELGYPTLDLNARYSGEAYSPVFSTQHDGLRWGTSRAFIDPIRHRTNLFIYKFSHVTKVLLRGLDNEAYGVEYVRHGHKKLAYASKELILSAGTIHSPQILMLSGIGPKTHLESLKIEVKVNLPVGQNLQDHISSPIGPFLIDKPLSIIPERDINSDSITDFAVNGKGVLASVGIPATGFMVSNAAKANGESSWPDIQFLLLAYGIQESVVQDNAQVFNIREEVSQEYFSGLKGKDGFQIVVQLSRPKARGEIRLSGNNPFEPPLINPNYLDNDADLEVILEGTKIALSLVENTESFRKLNARLTNASFPGCTEHEFRSDAYWKCFIRSYSLTVYHQTGTCAMGTKDSGEAVVDSELRVLGTKGLRVIDASIMPRTTVGNTNAPTIMIGEMGSEFIKEHWAGIEKSRISKYFVDLG